jgi:hypothetical protein
MASSSSPAFLLHPALFRAEVERVHDNELVSLPVLVVPSVVGEDRKIRLLLPTGFHHRQ